MRTTSAPIAVLLALLAGLPGRTSAADVTGVVLRSPASLPEARSATRYRERKPETAPVEEAAPGCRCNPGVFAVVSLTGEDVGPPELPLAPPAMAQKEQAFVPAVLAIPVGATVEFPNFDPYFHNVFSYSKTKKFDLGRYPKGEIHSVQFDSPGIAPIFCEIHYSMRAYIHVFETPYFAVSDEARNFAIADVPPGEYVLHVWQENLPEITRPLKVGSERVYVEVP